MRVDSAMRVLCVAAIALLAGCNGGGTPSIAPRLAPPEGGAHSMIARAPSVITPVVWLEIGTRIGHHFAGYDSCHAKGPIKYMSDYNSNVIDIFEGKFAGQAPCGRIATGMLVKPQGLFVKTSTHDLYVANSGGGDILVFHRGQMHPYNTYIDPSGEATSDVTVAKDGTVIACNIGQPHNPLGGSISTWIEGPNGGKFVGTFPMPDATQGEFITVQKDGTVYYNAFSGEHGRPTGALWTVRCPAGLCGAQTQVFGVGFQFPGGLRSDENDDLLTVDQVLVLAERFELPNLTRRFYPLAGAVVPVGMAFNHLDHHWFIADARNNDLAEYLYPSFALVGTVPGNAGGIAIDVAVDPAR